MGLSDSFAIYGGGAENVAVENIQHGRKSRAGKCGSRNIGSERVWKAGIVLCSVLKQLIACTYFMAHVLSPSYMYLLQPVSLLFGAPC